MNFAILAASRSRTAPTGQWPGPVCVWDVRAGRVNVWASALSYWLHPNLGSLLQGGSAGGLRMKDDNFKVSHWSTAGLLAPHWLLVIT